MSKCYSAALVGILLEALGEHPDLHRELAEMLRDDRSVESAAGFIESPVAARRVGLHQDTLVRFAREARIPTACKAGREWRFPADLCPADIMPARGGNLAASSLPSGRRSSPTAAVPASFAAISGRT